MSRTTKRPSSVIPSTYASPANSSSMGTNITSAPTILQSLTSASYSVAWSAGSTPVGNLSIEASNDVELGPDGNILNPSTATWTQMPMTVAGVLVNSIPVSGNSGNGVIELLTTAVYAIRLVYTRASGSGTLNVLVNCKVS